MINIREMFELALQESIKADPANAPFPLDQEQAAIWHQARADAFQWVLEMLPPKSVPVQVTNGDVSKVVDAYVFGGDDSFGCVRVELEEFGKRLLTSANLRMPAVTKSERDDLISCYRELHRLFCHPEIGSNNIDLGELSAVACALRRIGVDPNEIDISFGERT